MGKNFMSYEDAQNIIGSNVNFIKQEDKKIKKDTAPAHNNKYDESSIPSSYTNKLYTYGNPSDMYPVSSIGGSTGFFEKGDILTRQHLSWDWGNYRRTGFKSYNDNYNRLAILKMTPPNASEAQILDEYYYYLVVAGDGTDITLNDKDNYFNGWTYAHSSLMFAHKFSEDGSEYPDESDYISQRDFGESYFGVLPTHSVPYPQAPDYWDGTLFVSSTLPIFNVDTQEGIDAFNDYQATGDYSNAENIEELKAIIKNSTCAIDVITGEWYSIENNEWVIKGTLIQNNQLNKSNDVSINNLQDNQILQYNQTSQKWENKDLKKYDGVKEQAIDATIDFIPSEPMQEKGKIEYFIRDGYSYDRIATFYNCTFRSYFIISASSSAERNAIFVSENIDAPGENWTKYDTPAPIVELNYFKDYYYCASESTIYRTNRFFNNFETISSISDFVKMYSTNNFIYFVGKTGIQQYGNSLNSISFNNIIDVAFGGGMIVVLTSEKGYYAYLDELETNTISTNLFTEFNLPSENFTKVIYGKGKFILAGDESDGTLYYSDDSCKTWIPITFVVKDGIPESNDQGLFNYSNFTYAKGVFFMGEDESCFKSYDLIHWVSLSDILLYECHGWFEDWIYGKEFYYYPTVSNVSEITDNKVDKIEGKGLSTNDYTNAEKQKNADNASAIEDLQEDISQSQTATGNPLTIESSESNLVECVAEVEAVQDLHGYDKPWVGGAGKNKLPILVDSESAYGIDFTILKDSANNKIGIDINNTLNRSSFGYEFARFTLAAGSYILTGIPLNTEIPTHQILIYSDDFSRTLAYVNNVNQQSASFTLAETQTIRVQLYVYQSTYSNVKVYPMIRLASETDATFEPYENKSSITGQTEVVIDDLGKNLCSGVIRGVYLGIDGTFNSNYTDYSTVAKKIRISPSTTYTFTCDVGVNSGDNAILFYDKDNNYLGRSTLIDFPRQNSITFTTPNNAHYLVGNVKQEVTDVGYFQLELGSTATTYEPYKGKTYTIQLGDTIYGGELDVITGELTVTHGEVDLGSLTWSYISQGYMNSDDIQSSVKIPATSGEIANVICSIVKTNSAYAIYNGENGIGVHTGGQIRVRYDGMPTDATAFKTAVTGQTLVYELATPYTIQLTPQQIRMLKGTNNISCNTGDLSIKYYPDNVLGQLKGDIEDEYDSNPKLPEVTSADNGKFLRVVNGSWVADTVPSAESEAY